MSRFLVVVGLCLVGVGLGLVTWLYRRPTQGPINYAGWPELTKQPIRVNESVFRWCRGPSPVEKARGPHFAPAVRVYANKIAAAHLRADRAGPLPVGSTIIKEKWWNEKDAAPTAVAAMIKREAGYDPEHGDWEYVYVRLGDEAQVDRGKMESCIACHARAAAQDYFYRTYSQPED